MTTEELPDATKIWFAWYATDHCTLCGNRGWIDTRGLRTPAGVEVGRLNYCLCPNGQALRAQGVDIRALIVDEWYETAFKPGIIRL